jgi:hypothetical protein
LAKNFEQTLDHAKCKTDLGFVWSILNRLATVETGVKTMDLTRNFEVLLFMAERKKQSGDP